MLFLTGILDTPTSQSVPLSLTVRRQIASLCETPEDVKRQERGSHVSQTGMNRGEGAGRATTVVQFFTGPYWGAVPMTSAILFITSQ